MGSWQHHSFLRRPHKICEEAGVGYVDLAGNARLAFDHVFIETRSPKNPFIEKRELRSLFAPRATRVLRGTAARAVANMEGQGTGRGVPRQLGLGERRTKGSVGPGMGGGSGAKRDSCEASGRVAGHMGQIGSLGRPRPSAEYSLLTTDPGEIASRSHEYFGDHRHAFTQWLAAELRHPYTTAPLVSVYVDEFPDDVANCAKLGSAPG